MNRNPSNNLYANVPGKNSKRIDFSNSNLNINSTNNLYENNTTNESGTLKWSENLPYNVYTNVFGENNEIHKSNTTGCIQKYQLNFMLGTKVSITNKSILESNSLSVKRKPSNSLYTNVSGISNDINEFGTLTSNHQHTNNKTFTISDANNERSEYSNTSMNNNRNPINRLINNNLLENFENLDSISSRNRKPIGHLYANMFVENSENFTTQNEPTDNNSINDSIMDYNQAQLSSQEINGTRQPTYENVQYPLYENVESFGEDHFPLHQSSEILNILNVKNM